MLWLSFRDMNKNQVFGEDTSDFLLALYERAPKLDWLRLVLDGLPGDLPFALRQRRVFVAASWPDAAALQRYLKRTFTEARRRVDDSTVAVFAGQAESELQEYRRNDPNTAMARLALHVTELVALVLKCFPEHGDGR
jgi:hypothetical protein